ncbi:MAG TPA: NAD(P)H-dependent oxidoreductase [Polyangiaceae bacterium]|nr:NAD(P)H-dependent oxidoreductase [Polyangiaceae bacterium]
MGGEPRLLLIYAHPYPERSRAGHTMIAALEDLPGVRIRALYDLYPSFDIDVEAEQQALTEARGLIWQHPIYWYSPPALLKQWFEKVLVRGFAYGPGGTALHGKECLWAPTTGGPFDSYRPGALHGRPFADYVPVVEQTARFCGMGWREPFVVHGSHQVTQTQLERLALDYRERVEKWLAELERTDGPARTNGPRRTEDEEAAP